MPDTLFRDFVGVKQYCLCKTRNRILPTSVIGIDLGTTNSALAYSRGEAVEVFPVLQFVNPGEEREEPLLPSFMFLEEPPIVGVLAQKKGLENAGRLVSSAKSWLSHAGADRTAAILPPNAP